MEKTPDIKRLNFARSHGYKYMGNGWFMPIDHIATIGDFKTIYNFSVHERINLRADMVGLCQKHSVYVMTYFLKRWKENHIYGRFLVNNKV